MGWGEMRPCVQYTGEMRTTRTSRAVSHSGRGNASTPVIGSWRWREVLLTFI